LGMWVGASEGAKYWLGVLNEIKNRGVEDMFFAIEKCNKMQCKSVTPFLSI
jgi:putative transposase